MDHIIRKHKSKKQKKRYFTQDAEDAIVAYNSTENSIERSRLYAEHIHWPFYKLTQNIIHTFKFYHTEVENLEDLQHELMVFLLSKIHLFDPSKGAKAYSYFGTAVKRWLIAYNQKNYTTKLKSVPIQELSNYSNLDSSSPEFIISKRMNSEIKSILEDNEDDLESDELSFKGYKEKDRLSLFIDEYVEYCTENIFFFFPKEYDAQIADSILELFRKRDVIDVFNKKALYIYIREMVDAKTPKITKIANLLYKVFQDKYMFYLEHGYFPHTKVPLSAYL
jgi:hypothetical protein